MEVSVFNVIYNYENKITERCFHCDTIKLKIRKNLSTFCFFLHAVNYYVYM